MSDYTKFLKNMPVMPTVATKIMSMAEDRLEISFKELEEIIKVDPGLSAKILRVANSALYARQKEVKNLQMAITLLGFKNIKSLVLLITAASMFSKQQKKKFFQFYWKHSILNAFIARELAVKAGFRNYADECFLAALLHDIGQVALHNTDSEKYNEILEAAKLKLIRISQAEQEVFGTDHKEVGGAILREWSFPDVYVDATLEHGSPNITSPNKQIILIISIADFLTSNIDLYTDNPLPLDLIQDIIKQTTISPAVLENFSDQFLEQMKTDTHFQECQSLIGGN